MAKRLEVMSQARFGVIRSQRAYDNRDADGKRGSAPCARPLRRRRGVCVKPERSVRELSTTLAAAAVPVSQASSLRALSPRVPQSSAPWRKASAAR